MKELSKKVRNISGPLTMVLFLAAIWSPDIYAVQITETAILCGFVFIVSAIMAANIDWQNL